MPHTVQIDVTKLECPRALLEVKMAMKALEPGQTAIVSLADEQSCDDVLRFVRLSGHQLIETKLQNKVYTVHIGIV